MRSRSRVAILSCLLVALWTPTLSLAVPLFPNPVLPVFLDPNDAIAVGDFNGDGREDVAVASYDGISLFMSLGGGDFVHGVDVSVPGNSRSIAVADLNGDRFQDLVAVNWSLSNVSVVLGMGDGTFSSETRFPTGRGPSCVRVGDFDSDGHPDLAVTNDNSDDVTILLGAGTGQFGPPRSFPVGPSPFSLAIQDFDGNGTLDIATANYTSGDVSVLLGDGAGSFQSQQSFPAGQYPVSMAASDFNSDGKADLVICFQDQGVRVLFGRGDGNFNPFTILTSDHSAADLAVGDLNADGKVDVAVAVGWPATPGIMVLLSHGDGTFAAPKPFGVGGGSARVTIGDLNGDGKADLAVTSGAIGVDVMEGRGDGTFNRLIRLDQESGTSDLIADDFNQDGKIDLAVGGPQAQDVRVLISHGDGSFEPPAGYSVLGSLVSLASADFSNDGKPDLLLVTYADGSVTRIYVLRGVGDGTFETMSPMMLSYYRGALAVADFNSDGNLDIALPNPTSPDVVIFPGHGDGTFGAGITVAVGRGASILAADDLNKDGRPDLVVVTIGYPPVPNSVGVLLGTGGGLFGTPVFHTLATQPYGALVTDLNADGNPDIFVNGVSRLAYEFLGRGDGSFDENFFFKSEQGRDLLAAGDFDGDSVVDLAMGMAGFAGELGVMRGVGDGSFGEVFMFDAGLYPKSPVVGDFNGDGRPDLALSNTDGVEIVLNQGGRIPNQPPVAVANAEARVECTSGQGGEVLLDGSESSDPNSSLGTNDDIAAFEWFENFGTPSAVVLGEGAQLSVTLPLGTHQITLRVTDTAGAMATDDTTVTIVDTTPPVLSIHLTPEILWPPDHRLVDVSAEVNVTDACGEAGFTLHSITSSDPGKLISSWDENEDVEGAEYGTPDVNYFLRASRNPHGGGRAYVIIYDAMDPSGNSSTGQATVIVPHDLRGLRSSALGLPLGRGKPKGLEPHP